MKPIISKISLAALSLMCLPMMGFAQDAEEPEQSAPEMKTNYLFKQKFTPEKVLPSGCGIFFTAGNGVFTCNGTPMFEFGKQLNDIAFSPAGTSCAVVSMDKKRPLAAVFAVSSDFDKTIEFKNKKLGDPSSVAYSPDARTLYLACGDKLNVMDSRTFVQSDTLALPFEPKSMSVSKNGYYITLVNGNRVCVYNLETKRPRHQMEYDDSVADAKFNGDVSEFAVLTTDGVLSVYDTRNFTFKKSIDDLDGGLGFDFNLDGKYVAILTASDRIEVINMLNTNDRKIYEVAGGSATDVIFLPDSQNRTLLAYNDLNALHANRMTELQPYYGKLVADKANALMSEWLKMMPGETVEEYNARVNDESRRRQQRLFEGEISTQFADDLLSMSSISLGKYDRANQVLDVDFDNMPSILLPVPEADLAEFGSSDNLEFRNARYGVMNDDNFELIYAEVFNNANGKTYTYDNIDRVPLSFVEGDDNVVSIEVIQQQHMEEMRLMEIRQQVIEEAKQENVISDHTQIAVNSRVDPAYDSEGNKILNYIVSFTYEVDPEFTAHEDFGPGKYHVEESGAASSMLQIVKTAFDGDFAQYFKAGKKLQVKISGTADSTPIVSTIKYDGSYGDFVDEPVYKDGNLTGLTIQGNEQVKQNEQLAFLRAVGVKQHLQNNIKQMNDINADYQYYITVAEGKGSQFRRINLEFTFVDAF